MSNSVPPRAAARLQAACSSEMLQLAPNLLQFTQAPACLTGTLLFTVVHSVANVKPDPKPQVNRSLLLSKSALIAQRCLQDFQSLEKLPDIYYFNLMHCKNELWIPIYFGETLQNIWSHQLRCKSRVLCCCFQNKILSMRLLASSRPNCAFTVLTHVSDWRDVSPVLSGSSSLPVHTNHFQLGLN